jgi:hypothetical protein
MAATAACGRPRWAKLSPNVTDLVPIAAAARAGGAEAVTLVNTILAMASTRRRAASTRAQCEEALSGLPSTPSPSGRSTTHASFPTYPEGVGVAGGTDAAELVLAERAPQAGTATFADPGSVRPRELEMGPSHRSGSIRANVVQPKEITIATATAAPRTSARRYGRPRLDDSRPHSACPELQPWPGVARWASSYKAVRTSSAP